MISDFPSLSPAFGALDRPHRATQRLAVLCAVPFRAFVHSFRWGTCIEILFVIVNYFAYVAVQRILGEILLSSSSSQHAQIELDTWQVF
jgi:hypothetical protein